MKLRTGHIGGYSTQCQLIMEAEPLPTKLQPDVFPWNEGWTARDVPAVRNVVGPGGINVSHFHVTKNMYDAEWLPRPEGSQLKI